MINAGNVIPKAGDREKVSVVSTYTGVMEILIQRIFISYSRTLTSAKHKENICIQYDWDRLRANRMFECVGRYQAMMTRY